MSSVSSLLVAVDAVFDCSLCGVPELFLEVPHGKQKIWMGGG
jgi:hypothetical protein